MAHARQLEEPDVTPLINVNLVILVMVLAIASHAARLLPMAIPKAKEKTTFIDMADAVLLTVGEDGKYSLEGQSGLGPDALGEAIGQLPEDSIVLVNAHPKAKYKALVTVVDRLVARPGLQVAFGHPGRPKPAPDAAPPDASKKTPAPSG